MHWTCGHYRHQVIPIVLYACMFGFTASVTSETFSCVENTQKEMLYSRDVPVKVYTMSMYTDCK